MSVDRAPSDLRRMNALLPSAAVTRRRDLFDLCREAKSTKARLHEIANDLEKLADELEGQSDPERRP